MAVEAVRAGIVSRKFPENGKSTGNFSTFRRYATALPYVTTCIYYDYCAHRESGAIFNRELSGMQRQVSIHQRGNLAQRIDLEVFSIPREGHLLHDFIRDILDVQCSKNFAHVRGAVHAIP